jgi:hypothetical protein
MADKELVDRIAAAVEDAEAMPDEELDWTAPPATGGQAQPRSTAFALQWSGPRNCVSWRRSVVLHPPC